MPFFIRVFDRLLTDSKGYKDNKKQDNKVEHVLHHSVHHGNNRTEVFADRQKFKKPDIEVVDDSAVDYPSIGSCMRVPSK